MANLVSAGQGKVNTVPASATYSLGDAGANHCVSRWIVQCVCTGGTISVTPQKAASIFDPGPGGSNTQLAFANCWWTDAMANAAQTAGTALAASGIMDIDAAGCDVQLVVAISGGGTLTFVANPMLG